MIKKLIALLFFLPSPVLAGDMFELGGAIRNVGDGWSIIRDKSHQPLNLYTIEEHSDRLELIYSLNASKVITFIVTPDETYSNKQIDVGASVGLKSAVIKFSKNGEFISPKDLTEEWGNFWIYGKMLK